MNRMAPTGTLKAVRAELPWTMEADERLFMNGYQTWTFSPELSRNGKLRGTDATSWNCPPLRK